MYAPWAKNTLPTSLKQATILLYLNWRPYKNSAMTPHHLGHSPHGLANRHNPCTIWLWISCGVSCLCSCGGMAVRCSTSQMDRGSWSVLSPKSTLVASLYYSPQLGLRIKDAEPGTILANLPLDYGDLGAGKVYDLVFDSETRFHLKVDGPGWHVQVPHDIIPSQSGLAYSHTINSGKPVASSEPRAIPPYTLDANCEWVIDRKSRKICWCPLGNLRRGDGGHF